MNANTNSASHLAPAGSDADSSSQGVDWERRYQVGDTPWDKGMAAPPLVDFLARHPISGSVFVPGCGAGHDVRALAAQGTSVVGLDLAESAIAMARKFTPVNAETYELGDLFFLPPSWYDRFDWVMEHTCFCAICPSHRLKYVNAITTVLKPDAYFFAIFFINPDVEEGPPFSVSKEELSATFDPHFELLQEWIPSQTYAGRAGRELCQLRKVRKSV